MCLFYFFHARTKNKIPGMFITLEVNQTWMGSTITLNYLESADAYLWNFKNLMNLIRAVMRKDDLPIVVRKINDSHMYLDGAPTQPYIETVHLAQESF